ncbi:MAG: hypothetical protein CVT60_05010 [Actinobacteria bacterium HGW-Actinobacteria-10]|jgi:hypothetical protein|nr:MAG: hypothetical protein CVT60_05010 [Actinobacteria bacterium HGW-Actinobacteria-10]
MAEEYIPIGPEAPVQPTTEPAAEPVPEQVAASDEAWRDVVEQLNGLGEAIGRWATAAASDPAYREHAAEFKAGVEKITSSIGDAFDDASKSDVGQQFAQAATKTGEAFKTAGERVSQEAAPRIASAFGKAAATLQRAAERMERADETGSPATGPVTTRSAEPQANESPEGSSDIPE